MEPVAGPTLLSLSHKLLVQPVHEDVVASCPTMDLVAVASEDDHLDVYRFNGQRAFGLKRHGDDDRIDSLCWKFNGHYIAVGWHDGSVDVVSADNGETLKHFKQVTALAQRELPHFSHAISCIGWGVNFIDTEVIRSRLQRQAIDGNLSQPKDATEGLDLNEADLKLDDFLDRQPDLAKLRASASLPDQLALVDVQSILPKLPVLPPLPHVPGMPLISNGSSDIFASQVSLDAVIHEINRKDANAVDVLITCTENGTVRPVLYDSLALGILRTPGNWDFDRFRPILHTSHPFSCSHLLLVEAGRGNTISQTILVPLTLSFIRSSGFNLHLVTSRTAQLQNLLQYLDGCTISLAHYWNHSQDLPSKFMRNINETLEEKDEGLLVDNLYHLAVTGHCPATVKEWLVDELAERGHKRWDQATSHGYSKILELTHENLLPAIDRCSILLGRLHGLAIYHESLFDMSPQKITTILDLLRCLRLVGHLVLNYASDERQQFITFSKWLRHEIDIQATDPTSTSAEETAEKDLGLDTGMLLQYIQGALTQSTLKWLLARPSVAKDDQLGNTPPLEDLVRMLELRRKGQSIDIGAASIWNLLKHIKHQCNMLTSAITGWQTKNISMECGLILEREATTSSDIRMIYEGPQSVADIMTSYIALVPRASPHQIRLHRIRHKEAFVNAKECVHTNDRATLAFGEYVIKDIKFSDDNYLLALLQQNEQYRVVQIPYSDLDFQKHYRGRESSENLQLPNDGSGVEKTIFEVHVQEKIRQYTKHVFSANDRFYPSRLEVNGRKGRRVLCVLSEGGKEYKVFDMDNGGHDSTVLMDTSD